MAKRKKMVFIEEVTENIGKEIFSKLKVPVYYKDKKLIKKGSKLKWVKT